MPEGAYRPDFAKRGGLVPAIVQNAQTGRVLMLGWVNDAAWDHTQTTRLATFWSTSRNELWQKGATSGDGLKIVEILVDCDDDTVLYRVEPLGQGACHTKNAAGNTRVSCFYRRVEPAGNLTNLDP